MANQERKLRNNLQTLERETVSRLVNINRQGGLSRENNLKLERLNKEYFGKVNELMGTK